jgi:hypothetical protein
MWTCGCRAFHRIWLVKEGALTTLASLQFVLHWQGRSQQRFRLRQLHVLNGIS